MDEQHGQPSGSALSSEQSRPPGVYRWDGKVLRPVGGPSTGRVLLIGAGAVLLLLVGVGLGRSSVQSTTTSTSTATTTPTVAATPTAAPTPQTLSGTGSKVLPIVLAAGRYKVAWTAEGHDNFIVTILGGGSNQVHLVNEIPPNPSSGETVLEVHDTGSYTVQVEAATLTWTITLTPL
jgi:hypothetical protein